MAVPEGQEVECLLDAIKAQLGRSSAVPSAAEAAARRQALMQHLPKGMDVPQHMLDAAGMAPRLLLNGTQSSCDAMRTTYVCMLCCSTTRCTRCTPVLISRCMQLMLSHSSGHCAQTRTACKEHMCGGG